MYCCLSSQRYNFLKANHNMVPFGLPERCVVYQVKDTIFWKQITTSWRIKANRAMLFIKSKIQFFESKSQQTSTLPSTPLGCLSSQRYNFLKANHNAQSGAKRCRAVVYQVKDTIFWKQITTHKPFIITPIWLFIKSKIQFFESKSQPEWTLYNSPFSCLSSQRYNFLKANHNP